ncbi:MAG: LysM peptidoglycan-binding domain-containing protein, partial [Mariniphaga sp.]|nr:LysM peptidoglycan-binding domain-containing protein [Mariniphaga sp.]
TFMLYTILSGETSYSISKKFGMTVDELNTINPETKDRLNAGQTIKIPATKNEAKPIIANGSLNEESNDHLYIYHSVRKKETVFSIAQRSGITSEDIYQYNPQARNGIKEGEVLKIPKPQTSDNESKARIDETQQLIKHVVRRKETLFSIAKQYNITQEDILRANPTVRGGLSKGTVLIIPRASNIPAVQKKQKEPIQFSEYRIISGDNYYQLEKRFGTSKEQLELLNPALKDGFKSGLIIKIPIKEAGYAGNEKNASNQSNAENKKADDGSVAAPNISYSRQDKLFQIGIFLPFCQNLNDSAKIVQRTASFLEFYSGVLLATEKITEAGMKVKLYTYDTYQDSKVVDRLVKKPEFLSLDLIIGPVYPENQKTVAELSAKNRIPMISPLSSDSRFVSTTPGYYQINPGKKLRLTGTADYIADKFAGQNIVVLNHGANYGDEKLIIDRLHQKLGTGKLRQYNVWDGGTTGLETLLRTNVENIFVLTEGNEANVSVAMTRLNTISKSNKITVIGLQEYTKMQSIDIEHLHNIRLHYLAPYFIDYGNTKVNSFIEKYRAAYNSEPTQYSFQGYDIALHFMASLAMSGKSFPDTNVSPGVDLLQADYNFQKPSELGGYMNRTLFIIEYTDNYEVKTTGKILGPVVTDNGEGNEKKGLEQ